MNKFCCAFGHSDYFNIDSDNLTQLLFKITKEYSVNNFFVSDYGHFDSVFFSCAKQIKNQFSNIRLILVKPYYTKELIKDKVYYECTYDEIIIPEPSSIAHYKSAIGIRNKWMIDNSEIVISGVYRNYGGSFNAIKYAKKCNKNIFYLF